MRKCEVTGKKTIKGNKVSRIRGFVTSRTSRSLKVNLFYKKFSIPTLSRKIRIRVSPNGMRTIKKYGGIEEFLLLGDVRNASSKLFLLRKEISKLKEN